MASRIAAVILALVSVPLLALSISFQTCDEFAIFYGEVSSEEAQRQAQEWADDLGSRPGCRLVQAQASDGVAKAQYSEPAPIVPSVVSLAAVLSVMGAIVFAADGWVGRSKTPANRPPESPAT